jgi:acetyl/propionyl-CoA carboxylase alpha subunit
MKTALQTFLISGVKTNISLLYNIMTNDRYKSSELSTDFLQLEYKDGFDGSESLHLDAICSVSVILYCKTKLLEYQWIKGGDVNSSCPKTFHLFMDIGKSTVECKVEIIDSDKFKVTLRLNLDSNVG